MQQIADSLEAVVGPALPSLVLAEPTALSRGTHKSWGQKKAARKKDKGEQALEEFSTPLMQSDALKTVIERL